jgi:hypothetical protein
MRTRFPFNFTGAIVDYTAPTTGLYSILAFGAQGANTDFFGTQGGLGSEIGGTLSLTAGDGDRRGRRGKRGPGRRRRWWKLRI